MASDDPTAQDKTPDGSVALLPEPFEVDVAAVNLAAAAARAALRRTSEIGRAHV